MIMDRSHRRTMMTERVSSANAQAYGPEDFQDREAEPGQVQCTSQLKPRKIQVTRVCRTETTSETQRGSLLSIQQSTDYYVCEERST